MDVYLKYMREMKSNFYL